MTWSEMECGGGGGGVLGGVQEEEVYMAVHASLNICVTLQKTRGNMSLKVNIRNAM